MNCQGTGPCEGPGEPPPGCRGTARDAQILSLQQLLAGVVEGTADTLPAAELLFDYTVVGASIQSDSDDAERGQTSSGISSIKLLPLAKRRPSVSTKPS
jgi:hypothetical protein